MIPSKRFRALVLIAVVASLALPTAAEAGTVSVENVVKDSATSSTLRFAGGPGEDNAVTVTIATTAPPGELETLRVLDAGAPLTAGGGCTGGGPAGTPALCSIHTPRPAEQVYCGRDCIRTVPGSGFTDEMNVELGDGDDSFDASTFDGEYRMTVFGGPGADRISTGAATDTVAPGPGDDEVHLGLGGGEIAADPGPDGNDVLDVGREGLISYGARTAPVFLRGRIAGGAGENDTIEGDSVALEGGSGDDVFEGEVKLMLGGAGDDVLIGGPEANRIDGEAGDDRISGGAGDDELGGGAGDDVIEGGAGDDKIGEGESAGRAKGGTSISGDDVADGGEGNDVIALGDGNDQAEGGPGNDRIYGGAGNDRLSGGSGNDIIGGEEGSDTLAGGAGDDRLLAGRVGEQPSDFGEYEPVDLSADRLDCGPGTDFAKVNAWDKSVNCETSRLIRLARLGPLRRDPATGTASLAIEVIGSGHLTVSGRDVHDIGLQAHSGTEREPSALVHLRARGRALAILHRRGKVRVHLRIGYGARDARRRSEERAVTLILSPRPAPTSDSANPSS